MFPALLPFAASPEEPYELPRVEVSALTPLHADGLDADRVPANVQSMERSAGDNGALSLHALLNERIGSVNISDAQNNPLQPELSFRGFTVSPLLGLPQGIAVYQGRTRINEAFGDTVNFDLVPEFAIERIQLVPGSNPVYGLNALGGAITLEMKDGFSAAGTELELLGGSFGRRQLTGEHGANNGRQGVYVGVRRLSEDGWRDHSASEVKQVYTDFAHRGERLELGASIAVVESDLNGNGAAPVELLQASREAVFTYPDNTRNDLVFLQVRGDYRFTRRTSLQASLYYRGLQRDTTNGDETDIEACDDAPTLVCGDDGAPAVNTLGEPIPVARIGEEPFAVFNHSRTDTDGSGASVQATFRQPVGGFQNRLVIGLALDSATTAFGNDTEIGTLTPDRTVDPAGIFLGGSMFNTQLQTDVVHAGFYAADMLALTDTLDLTLSGRFNHARVELEDKLDDALTGEHVYNRFNPALGLTWQASDRTTTYASYSEANRVPTPAELSCADPQDPCRFPHAFVADPPLDQVVSRTVEIGARGDLRTRGENHGRWFVAPFLTVNEDDILFVSSGPVVGSGYFRNAGETRRVGLEAGIEGQGKRFGWFANYAYVQATFEDEQVLRSDHNPVANAVGEIHVNAGDRMPGIPLHSAKLGVHYAATPAWRVGLRGIHSSSRVLRGDEGNDRAEIDGFTILNLDTTYRLNENLEIFLLLENLLDTDYETFGTFGEADEVPLRELAEPAEDPRFLGPGAPLGAWLGLRLRM